VNIGVRDGRIAAISPDASMMARDSANDVALNGRLLVPGFVETHIHLDKSCISDRCACHTNKLKDVIAAVASAKQNFTEEDIYARGRRTLEKAIVQGTTRMRTHVEVDPRIGLKGFNTVGRLKRDFAWAMDIELCVFPQEGLLNDPGCDELLVAACENGAESIGGVPYVDTDPNGQIARIFELARHYDLDIDFHLDFDLDPSWMHLDEVCRQTDVYGWGGRVAIGHVSKLSALDEPSLKTAAARLANAGVAVTVLEWGVTCSLSTNNVLTPFTPFGDCSLVRMANLYANVAHVGQPTELAACLDMVTQFPAKLMNLKDYGIVVGNVADIVALDCVSPEAAVAELAQPLFGMKGGRISFSRDAAVVNWPGSVAARDDGFSNARMASKSGVCTENLSSGVVVVKSAKDGV
jgi:cytosine deaminase